MITVGLVDDQPLVRAGFAMLINSQDDMTVAWQASDGDEVPGQVHVDLVLMDIQMQRVDGISACERLLAADPGVKVIMLTTFDDQGFVRGAIEAGASGFLLKDAQPEELLAAVRTVYEGNAVLAPKVTKHVLQAARTPQARATARDDQALSALTPREVEILRLIALGLSNDEIANREFVSIATVKTHIRHILMKTQSRDRVHAVLFALRAGLVDVAELLSLGVDE
ncbi:response regulator transcription factor [Corynebacterium breve]|uniref:Response regulator transcription factor n=1 Tax=Corynebacterium breve TaxID=3049799 RepID=A0ABY8VC03_9CORY|nr:response regulator transcription factor [Corynebacterium breve]WIM66852.1 response regulator transcription factor [Corynebacterium breve]